MPHPGFAKMAACLFQRHDRDTVASLCPLAGTEARDIGRVLQVLAKDLFEPAGAMAMNDSHQERSAECGSIEVALERLERFVRSLPSNVYHT